MIVLGGRGGRGHAPIDVGGVSLRITTVSTGQEALEAARRVLRPRSVVAVGEQEDQPALVQPFGWGRHEHVTLHFRFI